MVLHVPHSGSPPRGFRKTKRVVARGTSLPSPQLPNAPCPRKPCQTRPRYVTTSTTGTWCADSVHTYILGRRGGAQKWRVLRGSSFNGRGMPHALQPNDPYCHRRNTMGAGPIDTVSLQAVVALLNSGSACDNSMMHRMRCLTFVFLFSCRRVRRMFLLTHSRGLSWNKAQLFLSLSHSPIPKAVLELLLMETPDWTSTVEFYFQHAPLYTSFLHLITNLSVEKIQHRLLTTSRNTSLPLYVSWLATTKYHIKN